jgi:hypothetical protein
MILRRRLIESGKFPSFTKQNHIEISLKPLMVNELAKTLGFQSHLRLSLSCGAQKRRDSVSCLGWRDPDEQTKF